MTESEEILLSEFQIGAITEATFLRSFPHGVDEDGAYVIREMMQAINENDPYRVDLLLPLVWLLPEQKHPVEVLNELLVYPHHHQHQRVAKALQNIKSPSTIPYVERVLDSNFSFLAYTASVDHVIAKWFSWLLAEIGTNEALEVMRRHSLSRNQGIREEMRYRLSKVDSD